MTTRVHPHRLTRSLGAAVAALALAAPAASAHHPRSDAVAVWNANAGKAAVAACISPVGPSPAEARIYAMTHIAIHDALNAIDRRSRPYAYHGRARRHASLDAAVATAARDVLVPTLGQLVWLVPQECADAAVASVEADYAAALDAIRDGRAKTRGVAVGAGRRGRHPRPQGRRTSWNELLVGDPDYEEGTEPGEYRFTPGTPFAFGPRFGELEPFVLRDGSQFRPGPPHAVTDPRYTADFNEIKRLGGDGVTTPSARTPDQTEIALFWFESSPLQWNRIARTVAARDPARPVGAGAPARLAQHGPGGRLHRDLRDEVPLQLLAAGHRDPGRGRRTATPTRTRDPGWTPLRQTPPIPDYDSGHAVEGGAAAEVLRRFFGTDRVRVQHLQHDAAGRGSKCDEDARAVPAPTAASPRRRGRTGCRASSSASTSARPWRSASSTDAGSGPTRSTAPCGRPAASPAARPAALVPARARLRHRGACRRAGRRRRRPSPSRGRGAGRARTTAAPRGAARRG